MKRVEMVVENEQLDAVVRVVQKHATGYTIVPDITGFGEHGLHSRDITLLVTVTTEHHLDPLIDAVVPILGSHAGIVLITDVTVLRPEHFIPEVREATRFGTSKL
ncbi:MAG: hypothetical protein NVS2B17_10100 [Candidatus Velthaea sp.]